MVRLLIEKNDNDDSNIGNIVYIADESDPPFSERELSLYDVVEITGFDNKADIRSTLSSNKVEIKEIHYWENGGKVFLINKEPGYEFSIKNLTGLDLVKLSNESVSVEEKNVILSNIVDNVSELPENNTTEVILRTV